MRLGGSVGRNSAQPCLKKLVRGLLVGLARRNEWYYRPSLEPAALECDLDGLTHEVAESEDGRFIFDIFEDSDGDSILHAPGQPIRNEDQIISIQNTNIP